MTRPILAVITLLLLLWSGGLLWFVTAVERGPEAPAARTDVIIVPTGGSGRLAEGLRLLEAGLAEQLFVSGVAPGVQADQLAELSAFDQPRLLACCVTLGYLADDTASNARETAAWMAERGFTSLRLVTSSYHMPRAMIEFRHALPNATLVANPIFPEHVRVDQWWRFRGTAGLIASEYAKYLWAFLRTELGSDEIRGTP